MGKRSVEPRITNLATHPRRYVSLVVAAEYLSITAKTMGEWLDEGRLPHANFGKRRKVRVEDIAAFERASRRA